MGMGLIGRFRRRRPEMPCQELVELLTDYLDGALPPDDQARLEEHLEMCEGCRMYVDQMGQTLAMLGRITPDDVSPEAQRVLGEAFREWRSASG